MFTEKTVSAGFGITEMLLALGMTLLLGGGISLVYRLTHRQTSYDRAFPASLVLSGAIVCFVILVIGGNVVLSVGMLGALSIVRFRTAVRDSRDMVYLFWAIAVGLACGTGHGRDAAAFSGVIALVDAALARQRGTDSRPTGCVVVVRGAGAVPEPALRETLERRWDGPVSMRSAELSKEGWEIVFEASGVRAPSQSAILEEFGRIPGVRGVSILAPQVSGLIA